MITLTKIPRISVFFLILLLLSFTACSAPKFYSNYHDPSMDFAALRAIAVMPFENLTGDRQAASRVRDILINNLLATGSIYVIPTGEVARGVLRSNIIKPEAPSLEEIAKLGPIIKADAVITGVVREYGQIRSGTAFANVVSLSLEMIDVQSKKIVWTASSTKGGISMKDRLLGSGGRPMDDVTVEAVNDIIDKLFEFSSP